MRKLLDHIVMAALLCCLSLHSQATEKATIAVSANGSVEVMPDYINISVDIEKTRKTKAEAKQEVDHITQQALTVIKKLGIRDKHVQASNIFARPEYQWKPDSKRVLVGEVVNRTISVKLYNLEDYSALAAELMKLDINNFNQNGFGYDNIEQYQNQALVNALQKAREKAELIASTLKVRLGEPWQVNESGGDFPMPVPYLAKGMRAEMAMMDSAPQEAPLDIKPQIITSSVNVVFLISK